MDPQSGKYIIFFGIVVVVLGVLIYFFPNTIRWLGHLPGDVRVERPDFKFYLPITTMIIVSLLLTLIINILKRF